MKKLISIALAFVMMVGMVVPIYADSESVEDAYKLKSNHNSELTIKVKNLDEANKIIELVDKHNLEVKQKWLKALNESKNPENLLEKYGSDYKVLDRISKANYYFESADYSFKKYNFLWGWNKFEGYISVRGKTKLDHWGGTIFDNINNVSFVSKETEDDVEDFNYEGVFIHARSTYAINLSAYIVIKYDDSNSVRYPISEYIEFYASGGYSYE